MATEKDIATAILQRLNIVSEWQNMTAQQENTCTEVMRRCHAELLARGAIRWDLDAIPAGAEDAFINVACYRLRNDYSIPQDRRLELAQDYHSAMIELYAQNSIEYDGEPVKAEYY